jgi:hypothetical protein
VERDVALLVAADLRENGVEHRIARGAFVERAVVALGDHLGDQEHHQLQVEPAQAPQPHKAGVTPVDARASRPGPG